MGGMWGAWTGRRLGLWAGLSLCAAPVVAMGLPAEELKYMSSSCATLLEAQRTAPNALRYQPSFAELQKNYQIQCAENQSEARNRLYKEKRQAKAQAAENEINDMRQKLASENAGKLQVAQCHEMKIALESRRKRSGPSEGDQRDLQRFEARFQERCR